MMSDIGEFGGYLSATFPSQINVDVTEFCNLACVHCPYESVVRPKGKARNNLSPTLHTKLVAEVAKDGKGHCHFVRYTGEGEPLLHPNMMDFLATMKATGVTTALTTNGILLTEKRCKDIIEIGTDVVDISIDAFKAETFAKIRVGGVLEEARSGVLRLFNISRDKGSKLKVMVSFIRQALNEGEEHDFLAYWKEQGLENVFVRNLHSCAGQMPDVAKILWENAPVLRKPCLYPWERLVLKSDGKVVFCPADWTHGTAVGDYSTDETMKELWQGEAMQAVRQAHTTGDFGNHSFCGQCPDWSVIRWPSEGRSYATAIHEVGEVRNTG